MELKEVNAFGKELKDNRVLTKALHLFLLRL